MFQIISIKRSLDQDCTDFFLLAYKIRMSARPIRLWRYAYWGTRHTHNSKVFQTPWLTFAITKEEKMKCH